MFLLTHSTLNRRQKTFQLIQCTGTDDQHAISLNFTEAVFLVASLWHPREDIVNKSRGNRTCQTRMLEGSLWGCRHVGRVGDDLTRYYKETGPVEFKLNQATMCSLSFIKSVVLMSILRCYCTCWNNTSFSVECFMSHSVQKLVISEHPSIHVVQRLHS